MVSSPSWRPGRSVADVGCGHGASTVLMAEAFPSSSFIGFHFHGPSIDAARERAAAAGVVDRVNFVQAEATNYADSGFDLVCFFDCLHDMGDPVGAARHAHQALNDDGSVSLVEPFAGDRLEDNCNPVGRMFYAASTFICTPSSLSQEVGRALGAQAGESRLRDVFTEAGFSIFRPRHRDTVQPHSRSTQSSQRDVRGADVVVLAALRVEASTLSPHAPRRRLLTPGPLAQHLGRHSQTRSLTQPATTTLPRPRTVPEGCRRVLDPLRERHRLGQAQQESSTQVGRGSTTISRTSSNRRSRTPCLGPDAHDYPMPLPALLGGP